MVSSHDEYESQRNIPKMATDITAVSDLWSKWRQQIWY